MTAHGPRKVRFGNIDNDEILSFLEMLSTMRQQPCGRMCQGNLVKRYLDQRPNVLGSKISGLAIQGFWVLTLREPTPQQKGEI